MYSKAPYQQQRGAAAPTSPHCQRLCKALLGPQVSFEKARCHYIQLKMRSLKQKEMGEVKVLKDLTGNLHRGLTETNLFLPLHKACFLTLPIPIHTHTQAQAYAFMRAQIKAKENEISTTCFCSPQPRVSLLASHSVLPEILRVTHDVGGCLLVLASSGDHRAGLEGGEPGTDRAAEGDRFCHRVSLLTQAKIMCL